MSRGVTFSAVVKYSGSFSPVVVAARHRLRVDQFAVGQQLEREDVDLFLRLLAFADDVAEIVMRERGSMPFEALFASDSEIVPVGAIEL